MRDSEDPVTFAFPKSVLSCQSRVSNTVSLVTTSRKARIWAWRIQRRLLGPTPPERGFDAFSVISAHLAAPGESLKNVENNWVTEALSLAIVHIIDRNSHQPLLGRSIAFKPSYSHTPCMFDLEFQSLFTQSHGTGCLGQKLPYRALVGGAHPKCSIKTVKTLGPPLPKRSDLLTRLAHMIGMKRYGRDTRGRRLRCRCPRCEQVKRAVSVALSS